MLFHKLISPLLYAVILIISLSSCSSDINEYKDQELPLDIKTYFTGNIMAWGMVQDFSTKVTRRFCVDIKGSWKGNTGTLDETFYFNDGEISTRIWSLTKTGEQTYLGNADDVIGQAHGKQSGIAFHWQYTLAVPIGDKVYELFLDDWMYKIDNNRLFNRISMNKLGIKVAEITLFFEKNKSNKTCESVDSYDT